jgi:hypothetical protein
LFIAEQFVPAFGQWTTIGLSLVAFSFFHASFFNARETFRSVSLFFRRSNGFCRLSP